MGQMTSDQFEVLMGSLGEIRSEVARLRMLVQGVRKEVDPRLTTQDLCKRWSCSARTIDRMIAQGTLEPSAGPGRMRRWTEEQVAKAEKRMKRKREAV